jgi:hypothetical protein
MMASTFPINSFSDVIRQAILRVECPKPPTGLSHRSISSTVEGGPTLSARLQAGASTERGVLQSAFVVPVT